jgi:hypothetical protein
MGVVGDLACGVTLANYSYESLLTPHDGDDSDWSTCTAKSKSFED